MHYVNFKVSRIASAVLQRRIYDKQRKDFIIRCGESSTQMQRREIIYW